MKSRYYDARAINKDVPIQEVFAMYGLKNSTRTNIPCPDSDFHTNGDKKPSAKIYTNNNICKCFACGTTFTPVSLVMREEQSGFLEACEKLVEQFNLPEGYYEENTTHYTDKKDVFPLTPDDIKLLGLKNGFGIIENVVNVTPIWDYDYENDDKYKIVEEEPIVEKVRYGLRDLWKEDINAFKDLIMFKVFEQMKVYAIDSVEFGTLMNIYNKLDLDAYVKENYTREGNDKMVNDKIFETYVAIRDASEDLSVSYKNLNGSLIDISAINKDKNALICRLRDGEFEGFMYKDYVYEKGTAGEPIEMENIPEDFKKVAEMVLEAFGKESFEIEAEMDEEELEM